MPISQGLYGGRASDSLYLKKIDQAFFEAYDRYPEEWSKFLNDKKGKGNNRVKQILTGIDKWERKGELENPVEKVIGKGPTITTFFDPYAIDVIMSREQYDDELWDEVETLAKDAGQAGAETVERECALVLDLAFDGTTQPLYDGKALCADDHPLYGVGAVGTCDNKLTGVLDDTGLKNALILLQSATDEAGKKIRQEARRLIVPTALQFTADVLLNSTLRAGTNNNDKNVLPSLQTVTAHYATSQVQWFVQADNHEMNHFWRVQPEFKRKPVMEDNHSYMWKGYFRHGISLENWRGIVGSTGV